MKDFFFLTLGLVIIVGSIFLFLTRPLATTEEFKIIRVNDVAIRVEIANTPGTRAQGLSARQGLAEGTGMLFVFDEPGKYGFWMKDMNFAIDIVWIDEASRVISVERNVLPETFPRVFYPNRAVKYVLELSAGATQRYRIDIGTVIQ